MASIQKRPDGRWQARYRVTPGGKQYSKTTRRKIDAQRWLDERTAAVQTGMHVDPRTARMTVEQWCALWLDGYGTRRESTVRQARVHVAKIVEAFGPAPLSSVRPSQVRAWCSKLAEDGHEPSSVHALHARLAQIFSDAVHDGLVPRNPCARVVRRRRWPASGPTWPPQSRCGRCTTRCRRICGPPSSSARSSDCARRRCAGCG
jgi:hypothetical protein